MVSEQEITRAGDVPDFQRVRVDSSAEVLIRLSPHCTVDLAVAREAVSQIGVEVVDGELRILGPRDPQDHARIEVASPALLSITHLGLGRVDVHLDLQRRLDLTSLGNGPMYAHGRIGYLRATLGGGGDMHLQDLVASHAWLQNHGTGNLHAVTTRTVRLDPLGSGAIRLNEHLKPKSRR